MKGLFYTWNVMKYSFPPFLILSIVLTGCIELENDKSDSRTVTLKNFRSATELSYKTTDTDWFFLEANDKDVFTFKTASDRKYQVSIDCPFNDKGLSRLYYLDQQTFSDLDLGCDQVLSKDVFSDLLQPEIYSYSLDASYKANYLVHPSSEHTDFGSSNYWSLFNKKRRIDREDPADIVGTVHIENEHCNYYLKKKVENIETADKNLLDREYLYEMPLYQYDNRFLHLGYFTSDKDIYPAGACIHFDIPREIRSNDDGYFFVHSSRKSTDLLPFWGPFHHIIWTQKDWYDDQIPDVEIPEIDLNPILRSNGDSGVVSISFDSTDTAELEVKFYSFIAAEKEIFVSNLYKNDGKFNLLLPQHQVSYPNTFEERIRSMVVNGYSSKLGKAINSHNTNIMIEDSTYYRY